MITEETVFILGAGASVPYGYQTGAGLRKSICKESVGSTHFENLIRDGSISLDEFDEEVWKNKGKDFTDIFFKSDTRSIDLFLNRNPKFADIGKISIIHRILEDEKSSAFNEDMRDNFKTQNWYSYLFDRMTSELTGPDEYEKFRENRVSFITFNYDRSLEYYLYDSLQNSFYESSKDPTKYRNLINQLRRTPIHHVYGCIASLPWQNGRGKTLEYRSHYTFKHIMEMKDNVRVIFERKNNENFEIINTILLAKRIFFLGFGYASENLEQIGIPDELTGDQQIFGTAYRLSEREINDNKKKLRKISPDGKRAITQKPALFDADCLTLLKRFL